MNFNIIKSVKSKRLTLNCTKTEQFVVKTHLSYTHEMMLNPLFILHTHNEEINPLHVGVWADDKLKISRLFSKNVEIQIIIAIFKFRIKMYQNECK